MLLKPILIPLHLLNRINRIPTNKALRVLIILRLLMRLSQLRKLINNRRRNHRHQKNNHHQIIHKVEEKPSLIDLPSVFPPLTGLGDQPVFVIVVGLR